MIGHLALGAEIVGSAAGDCRPSAAQLSCIASSRITGPTGTARAGSRLRDTGGARSYRLNALDAGVKGALEHGLQ